MLAQFQIRYPTGSLVSELVTIDRGKYLVKASIQIEGVIRATGMAAADTVEQAEDQARIGNSLQYRRTTCGKNHPTSHPRGFEAPSAPRD
jgi:hypothetical protein